MKFTLTSKWKFVPPKTEIRDVPSPLCRPPVVAFVASAFVEIGPWGNFLVRDRLADQLDSFILTHADAGPFGRSAIP